MENDNFSVDEGKSLAHLYDGAKDLGKVDQQVHDRLIQDAIKDHNGRINLDTVKKSMIEESAKIGNKSVTITEDQAGQIKRDNNSLPLLNLFDNGKLYNPAEATQAVLNDDAAKAQKDNPKVDLSKFWIPTLFDSIVKASDQKSHS